MRKQPHKTRTYFHHHMDSTRWEVYAPRPDDIIITTSYKSGTTLTQQLLYNMLVRDTSADAFAPAVDAFSPWIDSRFYRVPKDELAAYIDALPHRRFLKSHLPFDGLPYYPQVKYLIVARDPRDVFMSLLNHYGAYSASQYARLDADAPQPMPRFDGDAKALWRNWISRGWFDWEEEGWPFWSNMYHTKTYWDFRELPNFLFLHYAELRRDLEGAIRRIGDFIEHELTRADVDRIARAVSFEKESRRQSLNLRRWVMMAASRAVRQRSSTKPVMAAGMTSWMSRIWPFTGRSATGCCRPTVLPGSSSPRGLPFVSVSDSAIVADLVFLAVEDR